MDFGKTIRRGVEPKPIEAPEFVPTPQKVAEPETVPVRKE